VRRQTYEDLGGFRLDLCYALDWEMWIRIAAFRTIWYETTPMACYRKNPGSATHVVNRAGQLTPDERRCIEIARSYLPSDIAEPLSSKALELCGLRAMEQAKLLLRDYRFASALSQIREGLRCSRSLRVLWALCIFIPLWYPAMLLRRSAFRLLRSFGVTNLSTRPW
jgi:hypothetical protein